MHIHGMGSYVMHGCYSGTSDSEPSIIGTLYNKPLYKDIAQGPKITFP